MTKIPETGSEAFRWLDANMVASAEAPDEALDWIFMLCADDWPLLESVWANRSEDWREACAYLAGEGPVLPSQRLLRLALADTSDKVASQAAISLCTQMLEHPDKAPLDAIVLRQLKELRRRNPRGRMEEVDEIFRLHVPWDRHLSELFGGLGQDPIEDAPSLMNLLGTGDEQGEWLAALAAAIAASYAGDGRVIQIINRSGHRITDPSEAAPCFEVLRDLYLREIA